MPNKDCDIKHQTTFQRSIATNKGAGLMASKKKINGLTMTQTNRLRQLLLSIEDELRKNIIERSDSYPRIVRDQNIEEFEQASINQRQAVTLRILDKEVKLLGRIEHALSKFETGQYGLCEARDKPIGYPRLKAVPWARYCIAYKKQREKMEYMRSTRLAGR